MNTIILVTTVCLGNLIISEVCSNPQTETSGEFVELFNNSSEIIDVTGYSLTDGDALDNLLPWMGTFPYGPVVTKTTQIPAGGYAILLEEDYPGDPWLEFAEGTVILTTGDHSICNGLASSDPLTLYDAEGTLIENILSSFGTPIISNNWSECDDNGLDTIPFDPGEELSIGRFPLDSQDLEGFWFAGEPSAGSETQAPPDTSYLLIDTLFLNREDPLPGTTITLTTIISCFGTVSPDTGNVCLYVDVNGDSLSQPDEILYITAANFLTPGQSDTLSTTFTAPEQGNYPAVCSVPESESRIHFTTNGGIKPFITEIMANPISEDTEEFIEIYFPGPGVFPLTGCSFTDGDAVDLIISYNGFNYISSDQAAVILDSEYQGTHNIPPDTPLFTTENTTLGNGLTANDPILLYNLGEPSLLTLLSTAGTPLLFDDPLLCDDDNLDSIAFDPGNGFSIEKVSATGPDAEFNWVSSNGTPGTIIENPGWTDLSADTVYIVNDFNINAEFSNCGTCFSEGLCKLFLDFDGNIEPAPGEIFHEEFLTLTPGQKDTITFTYQLPDSGLFTVASYIEAPLDTTISNNSSSCAYIPAKPVWPVVTEILANPEDEDCDEFIEIYFPGPGQIDPTIFIISDNDAEDDLVSSTIQFLMADSYAVILDPEYENGNQPYNIPEETIILHPGNTTICDGLSGNDPVLLLLDSLVLSTYGTPENQADDIPYDPGEDLSVERIAANLEDNEDNWFTSTNGATPGMPPDNITEGIDYSINLLRLSPPMGENNTDVQIPVTLTSFGLDSVQQDEITVVFFADEIEFYSINPIPPSLGDTILVETYWESNLEETQIKVEVICARDENMSNNTVVTVWNQAPTLCINEIFFFETEWIELFNSTEDVLNLANFTLSDISSSSSLPDEQVSSGDFIVITEDEDDFSYRWGNINCPIIEIDNWPSLNNSGDSLYMQNSSQFIDLVPYEKDWGGSESSSLERRSSDAFGFESENWGTSITNATPGAVNSIQNRSSDEFLTLSPLTFNPPETPLKIEINLPMQASEVTVKIYDVRGMVLEELYSDIVPGELLVLEWFGSQYPIGRYIVFAEAICNGEKITDSKVVVLARNL